MKNCSRKRAVTISFIRTNITAKRLMRQNKHSDKTKKGTGKLVLSRAFETVEKLPPDSERTWAARGKKAWKRGLALFSI